MRQISPKVTLSTCQKAWIQVIHSNVSFSDAMFKKKNILSCSINITFPNSYHKCIFDKVCLSFWRKMVFRCFGCFYQQKRLQNRVFWIRKYQDILKKKILRGTFWKIWHIQIQIYPQTYIESKYGAFYLKNEVSAHGLVLLVQLS